VGQRQRRGTPTARGFTLVEMLAVVAIMGLVMAITVVAFTGIGRGAAISAAANQMHSSLRLARQYAVTRRIPVAFLVCDSDFADRYGRAASGDDIEPEKLFGKSYAIFDIRHGRYLQPWTELPKNVTFDERIVDAFGQSLGENVLQIATVEPAIPFPNNWNTNSARMCRFYGVRFNADGRIHTQVSQHWYRWFLVCEGAFDVNRDRWVRKGKDQMTVAPNTLTHGVQVAYAGNVKAQPLKVK
jgi:prepilin-type N-terminal cleavage/methylation domain-containing protein